MHAEPLAADEQPSERALAAALRVPGVIEVHNATVLMRPGGRAITLHARVDADLPLRGGGAHHAAAARRDPPRDRGHRRLRPPRAACAGRGGGLRRDRAPRRPLRARGRGRPARRGRARRGARVRPRRPLRRGAARARGAPGSPSPTRTRWPGASRSRCARRSTSSRRSWWRSTRDGRAGARRRVCWHAPTTGSSRRGPTASCARAGRARPTPCSCSARHSG